MGGCVGKPTLRVGDPSDLIELVFRDAFAGRKRSDHPGKGKAVAGSNHRGNPLVALAGPRGARGIGSKTPPLRKSKGGPRSFRGRVLVRLHAVLVGNSG